VLLLRLVCRRLFEESVGPHMTRRKKAARPTRDEVFDARTPKGGWTRSQLENWGVPWPPQKGWIARLCGDEAPSASHPTRIDPSLPIEEQAKQAINFAHREMMVGSIKKAQKLAAQAVTLSDQAGLTADYCGAAKGLKQRIDRLSSEARP
jgi:hypothetical protein